MLKGGGTEGSQIIFNPPLFPRFLEKLMADHWPKLPKFRQARNANPDEGEWLSSTTLFIPLVLLLFVLCIALRPIFGGDKAPPTTHAIVVDSV